MTIQHYWKLLESHDWFYQFSEDSSVYHRGRLENKVLKSYPQYNELYSAYFKFKFNNGPKPQKP